MPIIKPCVLFLWAAFCLHLSVQLYGKPDVPYQNPLPLSRAGVSDSGLYQYTIYASCENFNYPLLKTTHWKGDSLSFQLSPITHTIRGIQLTLFPFSTGAALYKIECANGNTLTMNCGSLVLMNPQSATYFNFEKGEACFTIKQNTRIELKDSIGIWALSGSRLTIKYYPEHGDNVEIRLLEGLARIDKETFNKELQPNELIVYSPEGEFSTTPNSEDNLSWLNQSFYTPSIDYTELIYCIARWYGLTVIVKDKVSNKTLSFNGSYGEPITTIIDRLNHKSKKFACSLRGNELIVTRKKDPGG